MQQINIFEFSCDKLVLSAGRSRVKEVMSIPGSGGMTDAVKSQLRKICYEVQVVKQLKS